MNKENELYHFGVKGQKWGIRRYQNKDGTLTPAGRQRYGDASNVSARNLKKQVKRFRSTGRTDTKTQEELNKVERKLKTTKEYKRLDNANKTIQELNDYVKTINPRAKFVLTNDQVREYNKILQDYTNKAKEYVYENKERFAAATLQDLGYENTKRGRDWLIKNDFISW